MTFGLYDTFANPQGCHIIREALYVKYTQVSALVISCIQDMPTYKGTISDLQGDQAMVGWLL